MLDTYAWIEYFIGSQKGLKVKKIIEDKRNTLVTAESTIGEVLWWTMQNGKDFGELLIVIRDRSHIIDISLNFWIGATKHKFEARKKHNDFGIIDALLLAVQDFTGATIVTGDPHFKGMKKVMMI